jgi:hypothetical protein
MAAELAFHNRAEDRVAVAGLAHDRRRHDPTEPRHRQVMRRLRRVLDSVSSPFSCRFSGGGEALEPAPELGAVLALVVFWDS